MPVRSRQANQRKRQRPAATVPNDERPRTVLTVGVTDHDAHWLGRIERPERFRYRPVGDFAQADNPELCRPRAFVNDAVSEAKRLDERVHGVVAFDDYPASLLAVAIAEKLGLPGPSLASVVACNNKAWSRALQAAAVPAAVPRFQIIDPHRTLRPGDLQLAFPFWLKPVKSSMSYLGFRVASFSEFERAVALSRAGLPAYSAAFQELMDMARPSIPGQAASVRADWLIAEELLSGRQCTLDGLMSAGELTLIGVVDSIRLPNRVSFARFDYPSRLRGAAQARMVDIAQRMLRRIGFDNGLFNIEFFVDERGETPKVIEINPRFSPQFSDLFEKVDGTLTHQYVVEMAAGETPSVMRRRGRHRIAASCVLRVARDHVVTRAPTARDIARLQSAVPDTHVYVTTAAGHRLSQSAQDSYTFRYGLIHLGARDRRDLKKKLTKAKRLLRYQLKPVEKSRG
jgi:biotin carboxylase